jgi:hypothetical protein
MNILVPEEKEGGKEITNKLLFVSREMKEWQQIGGAYIQGEWHTKLDKTVELHGRATIFMPNLFFLAGTFNHGILEEKNYLMLVNNGTKDVNSSRAKTSEFCCTIQKRSMAASLKTNNFTN